MASIGHREKDYRQRSVLDKLGIKPGDAVAIASGVNRLDPTLEPLVVDRLGRPLASDVEVLDIALVPVDETTDAVAELMHWRPRLVRNGGIWLLSPKRGQSGYVDQRVLIAAGLAAGLIDNKVCSVSGTTSAMRFVIRRTERGQGTSGS